MKIRQATMADAAVIASYNVALAKESEDMTLEPTRVRQGVEAVLRDAAKGVYFAAEEDDKLVGQLLVTYEWSDWRNGNFWWLQSVYVHPEFRSRGVFKTLFAHALEQAQKTAQVCGFRLYVEAHNSRAQDVYHRLGLKKSDYQVLERLFVC
jgi:ribosomal protein S18 acetylase RimI-like enzyme